jgi:hypothetical protein
MDSLSLGVDSKSRVFYENNKKKFLDEHSNRSALIKIKESLQFFSPS